MFEKTSLLTRLAAGLQVKAFMRLAESEGGFAMVLRRGDETSGDMLLILLEKGMNPVLFGRMPQKDGGYGWEEIVINLSKYNSLDEYVAIRAARDPDMWLIELDVPNRAPFTAILASLG